MQKQLKTRVETVLEIKERLEKGETWKDVLLATVTEDTHRVYQIAQNNGLVSTSDVQTTLDCLPYIASRHLRLLWRCGLLEPLTSTNTNHMVFKLKG
jgi:hypothetical protein